MASNLTDINNMLDKAHTYFNEVLFDGKLSNAALTLQHKKGAYGYFWDGVFVKRDGTQRSSEIALNPDTFSRPTALSLSTLVHEMAHQWQQEYGTPGRGKYHNAEWARKMVEIGLKPRSTDDPNRMTGDKVTHDIVIDGEFDRACADFISLTGAEIDWHSGSVILPEAVEPPTEKTKKVKKVLMVCPSCEQEAWAVATHRLLCGDCFIEGDLVVEMVEK